jgi:hypothetical protein
LEKEKCSKTSTLIAAPFGALPVRRPKNSSPHAIIKEEVRMKSDMKLVSVNVGAPRIVMSNGDPVSTGIFKEPVAGRVMLRTLNLDGDGQADLTVHGGPSKAVYAYPSEHYEYWKREFPEMKLPWGMFGENFTTEGITESSLRIGDRLRAGSAEHDAGVARSGLSMSVPYLKPGLRGADAGAVWGGARGDSLGEL